MADTLWQMLFYHPTRDQGELLIGAGTVLQEDCRLMFMDMQRKLDTDVEEASTDVKWL